MVVETCCCVLRAFTADIRNSDSCSFAHEGPGNRESDAAGASGDHRNFAVEPHSCSPSVSRPCRSLIPSPGDQNLWAQSLRPMDMTRLKPVKPKRVTPSGAWYKSLKQHTQTSS